jgi:thiol:disulfide interchange protein DsbC
MHLVRLSLALACALLVQQVQAETVPAKEVHALLLKHLPGLEPDQVRASTIPGLFEVDLNNGAAYVTADGRYLIKGDLFEIATRDNLTERRRQALRQTALAELDERQLIVFSPRVPKHTITVFTDVDCGFCRKLHNEMAQLNELGIKVRYAAFPRTGPGSESWNKMEAVWCAADRRDAITRAKRGEEVQRSERCATSAVQSQHDLGERFGARGTPLIVLEDGTTIDGYMPAQQLAARLEKKSQPVAAARP